LKSFTGSDLWAQTNYLSNITPQDLSLNRGRWLRLEVAERALALDAQIDDVYVLTGPLYEKTMPKLPNADEPHRIPSGYWKIVALDTGEAVGFIFQQFANEGKYCDRIVPISTIEKRAKLNVFPEVSLAALGSLKERIGC
jgi:endonuclease G